MVALSKEQFFLYVYGGNALHYFLLFTLLQ